MLKKWLVEVVGLRAAVVVIAVILAVCIAVANLGGVMSFWGGLFSMIGGSVTAQKDRVAASKDRKEEMYLDATAIQRRVQDARAAGVHPLYALGAQVNSPVLSVGTPSSAVDSVARGAAEIGDAISERSARAKLESQNDQAHEANLAESAARRRLLEAQADDYVMRTVLASEEARAIQRANAQQDIVKVPAQAKEYETPASSAGRKQFPGPFRPDGSSWRTSPTAQAQQMEDEYGEVTDFTYGPYRALNDWWWYNEGWKYFVPHSVYSRLQEAEKKRKKREEK